MRNLIFGGIGVVVGLVLFIGSLTAGSTPHAGGAYGAGQSAGEAARIPIAVVFVLAGLWAIRKGRASR